MQALPNVLKFTTLLIFRFANLLGCFKLSVVELTMLLLNKLQLPSLPHATISAHSLLVDVETVNS
jgi:hypothetical protein